MRMREIPVLTGQTCADLTGDKTEHAVFTKQVICTTQTPQAAYHQHLGAVAAHTANDWSGAFFAHSRFPRKRQLTNKAMESTERTFKLTRRTGKASHSRTYAATARTLWPGSKAITPCDLTLAPLGWSHSRSLHAVADEHTMEARQVAPVTRSKLARPQLVTSQDLSARTAQPTSCNRARRRAFHHHDWQALLPPRRSSMSLSIGVLHSRTSQPARTARHLAVERRNTLEEVVRLVTGASKNSECAALTPRPLPVRKVAGIEKQQGVQFGLLDIVPTCIWCNCRDSVRCVVERTVRILFLGVRAEELHETTLDLIGLHGGSTQLLRRPGAYLDVKQRRSARSTKFFQSSNQIISTLHRERVPIVGCRRYLGKTDRARRRVLPAG